MKTKTQTKLLLLFVGAGLSIASAAKSYNISVPDNAEVSGTQLKAGDYKVRIEGTVATLTGQDHKKVEATGSIQSSETKFIQTQLEVAKGSDGMNHLVAIDLGGTNTKLAFNN